MASGWCWRYDSLRSCLALPLRLIPAFAGLQDPRRISIVLHIQNHFVSRGMLSANDCELPCESLADRVDNQDEDLPYGLLLWPKLTKLSLSSLVAEDSGALRLCMMLNKSRCNSRSSDLVVVDDSGRTLCEDHHRVIMIKDRKFSWMLAQLIIDARFEVQGKLSYPSRQRVYVDDLRSEGRYVLEVRRARWFALDDCSTPYAVLED